jgi:hypothetical protein
MKLHNQFSVAQITQLKKESGEEGDSVPPEMLTLPPPVEWPSTLLEPLHVDNVSELSSELTDSSPDLSSAGTVLP